MKKKEYTVPETNVYAIAGNMLLDDIASTKRQVDGPTGPTGPVKDDGDLGDDEEPDPQAKGGFNGWNAWE